LAKSESDRQKQHEELNAKNYQIRLLEIQKEVGIKKLVESEKKVNDLQNNVNTMVALLAQKDSELKKLKSLPDAKEMLVDSGIESTILGVAKKSTAQSRELSHASLSLGTN
jgi:hypothetical protein